LVGLNLGELCNHLQRGQVYIARSLGAVPIPVPSHQFYGINLFGREVLYTDANSVSEIPENDEKSFTLAWGSPQTATLEGTGR
jgi:hypothetical protein